MDNAPPRLPHQLSAGAIRQSLHGAAFVEETAVGIQPCQLPGWARLRAGSVHFDVLARCTTGVTLELTTRASEIELELHFTRYAFLGSIDPIMVTAAAGERRFQFPIGDNEGTIVTEAEARPGSSSRICILLGTHDTAQSVVIRLPQGAGTTVIDVRADRPLEPRSVEPRPAWIHHGSSISHGTNLPAPDSPWPLRAARSLGVQLTNASFSGNCLLDPFVADALSGCAADFLSVEVGINIVNWDSHIDRTFVSALHGFLDTFRSRRPDMPILLITPFYCSFHENHGGPVDLGPDGHFRAVENPRAEALTLSDIRRLVQTIVDSRADSNLFTVDGRSLLGEAEADLLVDSLHPGESGTQLIADRFVENVRRRDDAVGRVLTSRANQGASQATIPDANGWLRAHPRR